MVNGPFAQIAEPSIGLRENWAKKKKKNATVSGAVLEGHIGEIEL